MPAVHAPPSNASHALSLQALTDQCVQCGLCLPACPTYALEPLEAESPRGRIALAKAWDSGILAPSATGDQHLDQCLGCRRCEAVCPAGVRYGEILVSARTSQRERRSTGTRQRVLEALTARPALLGTLLSMYRLAYPLLPGVLRRLPRPVAAPHRGAAPALAADRGAPSIAVFTGCVARSYDAALYAALLRLVAAVGTRLHFADGQTCCGSLHAHAGDTVRAQALVARNRDAFAEGETVLSLASGCHEHIADALRGKAQVVDAITWFAERASQLRFAPRRERIALHLPCTQRNVVKSDAALRALIGSVPELEIVLLDAGYGCCGAAGTQMLTEPERAARFRQPLLEQLVASGATRLLSANIGCRLHMANGTSMPVQHPLEFLAECLA